MSAGTLQNVMLRIRDAVPESPIAVFRCDKPGHLDAVFASTMITRRLIESHQAQKSGLIGVFDGSMDAGEVKAQLRQHIHETTR